MKQVLYVFTVSILFFIGPLSGQVNMSVPLMGNNILIGIGPEGPIEFRIEKDTLQLLFDHECLSSESVRRWFPYWVDWKEPDEETFSPWETRLAHTGCLRTPILAQWRADSARMFSFRYLDSLLITFGIDTSGSFTKLYPIVISDSVALRPDFDIDLSEYFYFPYFTSHQLAQTETLRRPEDLAPSDYQRINAWQQTPAALANLENFKNLRFPFRTAYMSLEMTNFVALALLANGIDPTIPENAYYRLIRELNKYPPEK